MSPRKSSAGLSTREWSRISSFRELTLSYEGGTEVLTLRQPDISPRGMFISTAERFPEGAVLKLTFRLSRSHRPISVRGEVRYCLAGVGIGVEFIGLPAADQKAIRTEIHDSFSSPSKRARA